MKRQLSVSAANRTASPQRLTLTVITLAVINVDRFKRNVGRWSHCSISTAALITDAMLVRLVGSEKESVTITTKRERRNKQLANC